MTQDSSGSPAAGSSGTPPAQSAPRGAVRVHDDVFISIASICACQVPGVAQVGEAPANQLNLRKLVGFSDSKGGVRLKRSNGQVKEIEIVISVREGHSLFLVAEQVQRSIKDAVEKMTATEIQRVHVYVEGIEFARADHGSVSLESVRLVAAEE